MYLSICQESQPAVFNYPVHAVSKTCYETLILSDGMLKYSCGECREVGVSKSSPAGVQPCQVFCPTRQNCSHLPGWKDGKPGTAVPLQDWSWVPVYTHTFTLLDYKHEPFPTLLK